MLLLAAMLLLCGKFPARALPLFDLIKEVGGVAAKSFLPVPAPADLGVDLLIENLEWPALDPLAPPGTLGLESDFVPSLLEEVKEYSVNEGSFTFDDD